MKMFSAIVFLLSAALVRSQCALEEIQPFVHLTHDNTVVLRGPVTGASVDKVVTHLMESDSDNLYLYLDTPGGSVIDGERLIQTIHALERTGKQVTVVASMALSMGFDILQYSGTRLITKGAILMQHQMASRVSGNVMSMNELMTFTNYIYNSTCEHQAHRLGMTVEQFKIRVNDEWWMYGKQGLENNAADDEALVLCTSELIKDTVSETFYTWFGPVTLVFSKCPLVERPLSIKWGEGDGGCCSEVDPENQTQDVSKIYDLVNEYQGEKTLVHYTQLVKA